VIVIVSSLFILKDIVKYDTPNTQKHSFVSVTDYINFAIVARKAFRHECLGRYQPEVKDASKNMEGETEG
jgi:hypothetical protein